MTAYTEPAPLLDRKTNGFRFGLEAEYLLADARTFEPLCYRELTFRELNDALESISLDGLPPFDNLKLESPHRKRMPYVVEGYGVVDAEFKTIDLLPKGIEIRTPLAGSIESCLDLLEILHARLQARLLLSGYQAVALSHHPVETHFEGPLNKRRYDWWQWAMQVMLTYGPDINVGLPAELTEGLDAKDLEAKVNYYAPALVALHVASPFRAGQLWELRGGVGKSLRTYRRSVVAPAIELHPDQGWRLEFKSFEMSSRREDFHNYFLLWLTLLLDEGLKGRASQQTRVYDLGQVARFGLEAETVRERAAEVLERAPRCLERWGFACDTLRLAEDRWQSGQTPADDLIALYRREGSLPAVLRSLATLRSSSRAASPTRQESEVSAAATL